MNALKDMLYYTHPFPTPSTKGDKMYVIDTAYDRNSHLVGTIVDVKPGGEVLNGKVWRSTADGYYVTGHLVNAVDGNTHYSSMLVGLTRSADSIFNVGRFNSRASFPDSGGGHFMMVTDMVTSDASYYGSDNADYGVLTTWVQAAPWAHTLMPNTTDSAATVALKREIAEKKWKLNRAIAEMAHEGYERNWTEQLRSLHSNEDLSFLPRPRLGVLYEGSVLIPSGEPRTARFDLPGNVAELIADIEKHTLGTASNMPPAIPVHITLPLDFHLDPETLNLPEIIREMELKIRRELDNHSLQLGQHRVSHFINGLSSLV